MRPKFKRVAASLLALTLVATLAACGGSDGSSAAHSDNDSSGANSNDLKPITFTYFSEDSSTNWNNMNDEVGKVITEKPA